MGAAALKKGRADSRSSETPPRGELRAVEAPKPKRPAIKVYTGGETLKHEIEAAAEADRPGQSASAFMLRLFWKHQQTRPAANHSASNES